MKKKPYFLLLALLLIGSSTFAQKIDVVFVRSSSNYRDSLTIDAIAGYADSSVYKVTELVKSVITLDDTTQLNAADVVIMGRNIGSSDVGTAQAAWDSIKSPVISMNMWGLRGLATKAWWTPNDACTNVVGNPDTVLQAVIIARDDTVFKGLTDTIVDWWSGTFSVFSQDAEGDDAGNGTLLAKTTDNRPLFIRWNANEEFYPGAGHSPKGERAFIGCGNDQSELNYFGFTEVSKTIFFNELARMTGYDPRKKVVFVRSSSNYRDSLTIDAIAGYADSSVYKVTELVKSVITLDDTTQLNAADVVIMGRNIGSSDVGTAQVAWDSVKSPVISMNMWGLRGLATKAWWTPNDACTNVVGNPDTVLQADILVADTVFKGLTDTIVDWWSGTFSVFSQDAEGDDAGNGTLLAQTTDKRPLFIRWNANEEFYPGAGHSPKGERAFIGCGNDQSELNYFGFTEVSKVVFFNELARMAGLPLTVFKSTTATLSDLTVDGTTVDGFDAATTTYDVELPIGTTSTTVAATPTDGKATVSGTGTVDVSSGTGVATIVVTAEAGNTETYTINFTVAKSDVATLSDLTVDGTTVASFDAATTTYDVELAAGTTSTTVAATPTDGKANVSGTGTVDVSSGTGVATIIVTADAGNTITYTINFTVAKSDVATLSDLTVDGTTVAGFDAATTTYDVELAAGTTSTTVAATPTDSKANVSGTGSVDVSSGTGTATIVVTAEAGNTETYTINFTVGTSAISDVNSFSLNIYPNPVNSILSIDVESEISSVFVYNANGDLVKSISHVNSNSVNIDVNKLNSGLYIVNVETVNNGSIKNSFIKK